MAATDEVRVFSMPGCDHCKQVKQFLGRHGVPFSDHDLTSDAEGQRFMDEQGYRVVPVVSVGEDVHIGGDTSALADLLVAHGLI
ncbi:glutaredoxin family protein [Olsenella uli]|uniref:glutaredoxin family protein n=1 Tax=Olsenella uli TaxID=133926 RepID=UPI0012ABA6D3|nr:glutaredoxin family protein [Olsenella uli]